MITSAFRVYEKGNPPLHRPQEMHQRKYDNPNLRPQEGNSPKKKVDDFPQSKKPSMAQGLMNKKDRQMPTSQRQINPYNFDMSQNSININVNNLIINNNQPNFPYPNNYGVYLSNSSVFSKLGSEIVGKPSNSSNHSISNNKSKSKKRQPVNNYSPKKNSFVINRSEPNVEKVIANLIEVTKEKPSDVNEPLKQSRDVNEENQLPQQGMKEKDSQENKEAVITCSDEMLNFNSVIWDALFDFEINVESRQSLSVSLKKCLHFLGEHIPINMNKANHLIISFDIFSPQSLNAAYNKLIKISIVMMIYFKFILLDFNYEMTLKSNVKKIANSLNMYLLAILENCFFASSSDKDSRNLIKMPNEFIEKYKKILKIHPIKKTKESTGQFGSSILKNLEIAINHIRQMSSNYFKIGYFKFIHNICFEFFRLIDTYSAVEMAQLTINNILFHVIHNNQQDKHKEQSLASQQIIFNPTTLMGICGFGNSVAPPFLPPAKDNVYTLVLDLDDTLVHFFYTPSGGTFLIRPGCLEFLDEMSQCFEIVVFTAAMKDYADGILNLIDPENKFIKHRLYRHHTSISGVSFVKDLTKLGRDLGRIIIIDNIRENFKLQPNNGLEIKTWSEEIRDNQLKDIQIMLKGLIMKKPTDVRGILKKVKVEITKRMKKNIISPYANIDIDKYALP